MSYEPGWRSGRYSFICDVCGFRFHSDEAQKRWDGLQVCRKDWEPRHPQLFVKARPEHIVPPWTRPEADEDTFTDICYVWARAPYADLAEADCAIVGNTTLSYEFLLALKAG